MTKRIKKIVVGVIIWQAVVVLLSLLFVSISFEPQKFLDVYLATAWISALIVSLIAVIVMGLLYVVDD